MSERMQDHRRRAVEDLGCDLAVTAGAGSGKTTVLVKRFVNIACQPGLGPDRILAITFTRKAAAEMKERVIRIFDEAGDAERRRQVEGAYISTIHGFAERILREQPFEARIDPAFQVLSDYQQRTFVEEALIGMYERTDLRSFASRLGRKFDGGWVIFSLVQEVARCLREGSDRARAEATLMSDPEACVRAAVDRAIAYREQCERELLAVLEVLCRMLHEVAWTSNGSSKADGLKFAELAKFCVQAGELGVAPGDWPKTGFTRAIPEGLRELVKEQLGAFKKLRDEVDAVVPADQESLERELLPLKLAIYAAAADVNAAYAEHKRRNGLLDFHDLQRLALDLLRGNERVRLGYAERFRHILVDEAQDTDELQFGLVKALRTPANTMFVVGDEKQAIYEFRGANPDVFKAAVEELPTEAQLQLAENFRSRHEVVRVLNRVGPPLLPTTFVEIDGQADYGREELGAPVVTAILAHREDPGLALEEGEVEALSAARHREAAAVAEEVSALLQSGTRIRNPESHTVEWTTLSPRHVALLFRTRTAVPYFERAFAERGIPYVTAAGEGFYERAEVLDCIMLLRVVAQPLDDLALAALLRSPFFGVDDATLFALRSGSQGKAARTLHGALGQDERTVGVREQLDAFRRKYRGMAASVVLEAALAEWGYELAVAGHEDGVAMLANLAKIRRQVRDLGAVGAYEAVQELEHTRELMDREAMAPLVGTSDDVVVFSTIHQAKGLEWPVVCLANLQAGSRNDLPKFSAGSGLLMLDALDANGEKAKPASWKLAAADAKRRMEAEERRLLYVALTRARERLILSASVKDGDLAVSAKEEYGKPLQLLLRATDGLIATAGSHAWVGVDVVVRHASAIVPVTPFESGAPLVRDLRPAVIPAAPRSEAPIVALPQSVKVTELLSYRRCPQVYRFLHVLEIEENLARRAAVRGEETSLSAVELGTRVHHMLERARFDAPDLEAEVIGLLEGEQDPDRRRMRDMLLSVLNGELGAQVREAQRVEREWPFAAQLGGVLVEGVIDLALQRAHGGWCIVDYKSNDLSRTGRYEYLTEYYRPQLELYAAALERAGLGTVNECALVFLADGRIHRWTVESKDAVVGAAGEIIERIARSDFGTTPGSKCEACGYRKRKVCAVGQGWSGTPAASPRGCGTHVKE